MRNSPSSGFTLIEVAFAILVLAASLITILGLQSSIITRSTHDKNSQRAMLKTREILSALETVIEEQKSAPDGTKEGTPSEVLNGLLGADAVKNEDPADEELLHARLSIADWGIEGVPPEVVKVKKVDLQVAWSNAPGDAIVVTYFVAEDPQQ